MEQTSLFKPEQLPKQRFTYCINSWDDHHWRYRTRYRGQSITPPLALVFETKRDDLSAVNRLMRDWRIEWAVTCAHRWFVQYPGKVVVGTFPVFRPLREHLEATPRGGVGYTFGGHSHHAQTWSYKSLFERCIMLDRLTNNCRLCEIPPEECFGDLIGVSYETCGTVLDDVLAEEEAEESERRKQWPRPRPRPRALKLRRTLARIFRGPWELVSPRACTDMAFAAYLQPINNIDFRDIAASQARDQARAQQAQRTRQALQRCKASCLFYTHCEATSKPYYGLPAKCQTPSDGHQVVGPFDASLVQRVARWFVEAGGLGKRTLEDVALIARNAGLETRLPDGCLWILGRFTDDFTQVKFLSRGGAVERAFGWEDTMRLIYTPYRESGEYVYPSVSSAGRVMTDEELLVYAELCNMKNFYKGRGNCGWGISDVGIGDVWWSPYGDFYINHSKHTKWQERYIGSYAALKACQYERCPRVMREYLRAHPGVREQAGKDS